MGFKLSDLARVSPFKLTGVSHGHVSVVQEHFLTSGHKKSHFTFSQPSSGISHCSKETSPLHWRMVFTIWAPGAVSLLLGFLLYLVPFRSQNQGTHVYMYIFFCLSLCIFHFENLELIPLPLIPNFVFATPFSSSENLVIFSYLVSSLVYNQFPRAVTVLPLCGQATSPQEYLHHLARGNNSDRLCILRPLGLQHMARLPSVWFLLHLAGFRLVTRGRSSTRSPSSPHLGFLTPLWATAIPLSQSQCRCSPHLATPHRWNSYCQANSEKLIKMYTLRSSMKVSAISSACSTCIFLTTCAT